MPPLVSIIIPTFNAARWITETLRSALAQTCSNIEVIVVDDGSRDGTPGIVESIRDGRIRLIQQENRGVCVASNRGAFESTGAFIKYLDHDDWLNPEHLASQLAALHGQDGCVASCRWGYFLDKPENPCLKSEFTHRDYRDPLEWLIDSFTKDEGMMGGWMWLIPRSVWVRAGGWNERLTLDNDVEYSTRLLLASQGVCFASKAVYSYRKGVQGTLSGTRGRASLESASRATELVCRHLLQRESSARIRRVCANRWQEWLHLFYPEHPDLAGHAENQVTALGGSELRLHGGWILQCLLPLLGWKRVRRLQVLSRSCGWNSVLRWKAKRRQKSLHVS